MADTMSESIGALRLDSKRLCCQCMASASHWPPECFGVTLCIDIVACCLSLVRRTVSKTAMRLPRAMCWPAAKRVMLVDT